MSAAVVELGPSRHHESLNSPHSRLAHEPQNPDSTVSSVKMNSDSLMEDIIGTSDLQPSTSNAHERENRKKGFSFKKTAKTVVSGIMLKKKSAPEEKTASHEELRAEGGDQTPSKGKLKQLFNNLSNPSTKINKMWNSLSKTFSTSQNDERFVEIGESKSTMTLGRIYRRKKGDGPMKEDRRAYTLGRMFNFKEKSANTSGSEAANEGPGA